MKKTYRHGDVIIREVDKVEGAKRGDLVLAEGEVTGHSHRISKGNAALFDFNDKLYLEVQDDLATLIHEEHKALQIPRGNYEIIIQREYEPGGWRYVTD